MGYDVSFASRFEAVTFFDLVQHLEEGPAIPYIYPWFGDGYLLNTLVLVFVHSLYYPFGVLVWGVFGIKRPVTHS